MKINYKSLKKLVKPIITWLFILTGFNLASQVASFTSPTGTTVSGPLTNPISSGTMCAGVYTFTNASTAATNYTWFTTPSTNVAISNPYAASPTFTFSNTSLVQYTISLIVNGPGPNAYTGQVIKVVAKPNPILSASSDSFCPGTSTTLSVSPAFGNYLWSNAATTQTTIDTPVNSTIYSFTTTLGGINGFPLCVSTKSINITVYSSPFLMPSNSSSLICSGQSATLTAYSINAVTYTWSTGSTSSVIVVSPTVPTTYTLSGTTVAGCTGSTTISQNVSACTGILFHGSDNSSFNLYPNPTSGEININIENYEENIVVEIYNNLGQLIVKENVKNALFKINLSENTSGIYQARIIKNSKQVNVFKVIKN